MKSDLQEVIKNSTFAVHPGKYVYAKVASAPNLDDAFMISRDDNEITAVFEVARVGSFAIIEQNKDLRKLIEIKVSAPFYAVGFLAAITEAITAKGCNNLVVSTYSKDYVLVTEAHFEQAKQALVELGFSANKDKE